MTWLWLAIGLVVLTAGADGLVRGAVGLAAAVRISPLVVGLTVVAFGTSAPELVVSLRAALTGQPEIAVGNVVGSNIFNLMCVLGLTGLFTPAGVPVSAEAMAQDLPVMVLVSVACLPVFLIGHAIERWEGMVLLSFSGLYVAALVCAAQGLEQGLQLITTTAWVLGPLASGHCEGLVGVALEKLRGYSASCRGPRLSRRSSPSRPLPASRNATAAAK